MKEYTICISDDTPDEYREIIEKYWEMENEKFSHTSTQIRFKHTLKQNELNNIVSSNSFCTINIGRCWECGDQIIEKAYSQTAFNAAIRKRIIKCDACEKDYQLKMEEEREIARKLEETRLELALEDSENQENWKKLNQDELHVFKQIVRLNNRNRIFTFMYQYGYKETWKIINKLERLNLLHVKRAGSTITEFRISDHFIYLFTEENECTTDPNQTSNLDSFDTINTYTFNIPLNNSPISTRSPKYSKGFKLPIDVCFEKDVEYIVGAWILTDGSININFKPKNTIVKSEDRTLSEEENCAVFENPYNNQE